MGMNCGALQTQTHTLFSCSFTMSAAAPIDFVALARGKGRKGKKVAASPTRQAAKAEEGKSQAKADAKTEAGGAVDGTNGVANVSSQFTAGAGGAEDAAEFKPNNMKQSLLYGFANMTSQFLTAAATVWPKDTAIAAWNDKFNASVDATTSSEDGKAREAYFATLISGFHEAFKEHYSAITREDASMLNDDRNPWLVAVRAKAKYAEAHPQIRAQVWQYMAFLARLSNMYAMYSKCPERLLGCIHKLALQLGSQIQNKEISLSDLNPLTLGQHLMKVLTEDEITKFGTSVLSESNLEGCISMLSSMMGMLGGSSAPGWNIKDIIAMAGAG